MHNRVYELQNQFSQCSVVSILSHLGASMGTAAGVLLAAISYLPMYGSSRHKSPSFHNNYPLETILLSGLIGGAIGFAGGRGIGLGIRFFANKIRPVSAPQPSAPIEISNIKKPEM
jgi:hypothetical protein